MNHLIQDTLTMTRRNLAHVRQIPEKLLDVTIQPVMFVVLFAYVFGGVIAVPGSNYREYLIAGVIVQSLGFGIMGPATSVATDVNEGVIDRFRSLPMARSAYLLGNLIAELLSMSLAILVLSLAGLLVGWRIHSSPMEAVGGYALLLFFAFAMLWVGTYLGLMVRSPDAAQGVVFIVIFPLTFLATTFVPITGYTGVLRTIAAWNPISALSGAVRELFGNPTATPLDAPWPLTHAIATSLAWCALIVAIALPLALHRYATKARE
ncbi:MAG: ABC transporter permease [Gemmatimonadales bacterium]|jgi:ABC transporter DrrB family efflux protein